RVGDAELGLTLLGLALDRLPFLGEFGHSLEAVGQLEQIPPDIRKLRLPRQASQRIRDLAVMLAPGRMVAAGHAGRAPKASFILPTLVYTDTFRGITLA